MPIWLRNYTFNSIQEYYSKQYEESQKTESSSSTSSKEILRPDISPSYSTKASK